MKKLLFTCVLMATSAVANAGVYTCRAEKSGMNYLLVFDRVNHQLAIFSQLKSQIVNNNWSLMYGRAAIAYPMQPGSEYAAFVSTQDDSQTDWELVAPDTCFVHKIDGLDLRLKSTSGPQFKASIQHRPSLERNPNKSQNECPTPMPYIAPPVEITCDVM